MNWLDSYYEAVEFFYWEPQHIGRKRHPTAGLDSLDKVLRRLRTMEVTLNHNIHQFFLLAPIALRKDWFERVFGQGFGGPFRLHGRNVDTEFTLENSVQPDLLFVSDDEVVSIEMKIGAKCSVSQILKYALLGLAVEMRFNRSLRHHLVLLGSGQFRNQWREQFHSLTDLRDAIASADLAAFIKKQPARFQPYQERFGQIVNQIRLAFTSYQEFAAFLRGVAPAETEQSPGAEVYRNLTLGVVDELKRRHLAT